VLGKGTRFVGREAGGNVLSLAHFQIFADPLLKKSVDPPTPGRRDDMIGAIILGLVAGFIAKALLPGDDPGGFIVTILLGLAGSLVGFFLFTELLGIGDTQAFDLGGLIGAIIGTMLLLLAYRQFAKRT